MQEFEVMADSASEARKIAQEKYNSCEFVLNHGEVQGKRMSVVGLTKDNLEWVDF